MKKVSLTVITILIFIFYTSYTYQKSLNEMKPPEVRAKEIQSDQIKYMVSKVYNRYSDDPVTLEKSLNNHQVAYFQHVESGFNFYTLMSIIENVEKKYPNSYDKHLLIIEQQVSAHKRIHNMK